MEATRTELRADVADVRRDVAEVRRDLDDLGERVARIEGALTGPWRAPTNGGSPTCLAQEVRSAEIRRAMALIDDSWRPVTRGYLHRHPHDAGNPGTPPCTNLAVRSHAQGLAITMGGSTAGDPDASQELTIPR